MTETVSGALAHSHTFDDADRLLSDGTTTYGYDTAGNLTSTGTDSFTWDWNNRLQTATVNGTTSSYAYDGDGVRVETTVGSTVTTNVWDRESGLPLLLDDGTNAYLHADSVLGQIDASDDASSLMTDALGSVRGTTDGAGMVTGTAEYDVFGRLRSSSGSTGIFGFTGEQTEATGFTHLRARDYDPSTGRFLSADTVQPNAPGTQGYNRYAYVANNPTTWTDPSGHYATDAGALTPGMFAAITAIARVATLYLSVYLAAPVLAVLASPVFYVVLSLLAILLLLIVADIITVSTDPWTYFPDGSIPSIPPITLDPTRIWDAAQTFPNSPKDCLGGALSEIAKEQAQGILFGPPGSLEIIVAAMSGCAEHSGGKHDGGSGGDGNGSGSNGKPTITTNENDLKHIFRDVQGHVNPTSDAERQVDLTRFGGHFRVRDGDVPEGSPHGSESRTISGCLSS